MRGGTKLNKNTKNGFVLRKKNIKSVTYIKIGSDIKIIIQTKKNTYDAKLVTDNRTYSDSFNVEEPYDRHTHVFYVPENEFSTLNSFIFTVKMPKRSILRFCRTFESSSVSFESIEKLMADSDNGLRLTDETTEKICQGITYYHRLYVDNNGLPVHTYTAVISPEYASLYIGTPDDGYKNKKVRATVPDMIEAATRNGHDILTAVNADYFDILGDFHPAGLCVKNSRVIANPNSPRFFIALMNNGSHRITSLRELNGKTDEIVQAASGMQLIVDNGSLCDWAPGEPFGYICHPRTAAGIGNDGTLIFTVVDGRIPSHSNGATLTDLGKLMIEYGTVRALNMDGGGSSAMYTKKNGEFILRNRPADLFRPNAMLIRKDFNALLAEKRK